MGRLKGLSRMRGNSHVRFLGGRTVATRPAYPTTLVQSPIRWLGCGILLSMPKAIFIRPPTADERAAIEAGVRSPDAFVMRRCQMLLANARGESAIQIARHLSCHEQTVRNAIHAFNQQGLPSLQPGSSIPHNIGRAFDAAGAERLRALLHQSPRLFGKPTSLWTLALAAEVAYAEGLTPEQVSAETVRATLVRLGIGWRRAKDWITSPDPAYARKKTRATG